ncbi:methionine/alanine import family NSS transporter small subunit [Micrococcus luteus]|uniref:methionine/alanine import family NSS transporter small subunit n=1 Tax=Micrococcus luteus TaxID=1270 RepID=UPI000BF59893|nr:methionine/alanine import family NSS transporter small subunit [Micrococcus luteus]PFH05839.1 putative methionine/alanine importer small subunit [Micrococcaceae bacterium JKS001869]MCC0766192.1 methionine/alanine import family NSS transporter small subunit [Micrococcus luteus]MCV7718314.1 methionine/alanine import family NSS transporter small subunit [Micrococcus luteus]MCV7720305.1 methionine/alanine import family NSS transporter small subunit [Micrococcus luteus]MCV7741974.1 methionine/al
MSTAAIVMMSLAILLVWGGLAVSAVHLLRHPDDSSGDLAIEGELAPAVWEREDGRLDAQHR